MRARTIDPQAVTDQYSSLWNPPGTIAPFSRSGSMTDARIAASSPASGPHDERSFMDAEGARWRVFEQRFGEYDRRSGMSLIFASEGAVRRVRNYPANWMDLSDAELAALSCKP